MMFRSRLLEGSSPRSAGHCLADRSTRSCRSLPVEPPSVASLLAHERCDGARRQCKGLAVGDGSEARTSGASRSACTSGSSPALAAPMTPSRSELTCAKHCSADVGSTSQHVAKGGLLLCTALHGMPLERGDFHGGARLKTCRMLQMACQWMLRVPRRGLMSFLQAARLQNFAG